MRKESWSFEARTFVYIITSPKVIFGVWYGWCFPLWHLLVQPGETRELWWSSLAWEVTLELIGAHRSSAWGDDPNARCPAVTPGGPVSHLPWPFPAALHCVWMRVSLAQGGSWASCALVLRGGCTSWSLWRLLMWYSVGEVQTPINLKKKLAACKTRFLFFSP